MAACRDRLFSFLFFIITTIIIPPTYSFFIFHFPFFIFHFPFSIFHFPLSIFYFPFSILFICLGSGGVNFYGPLGVGLFLGFLFGLRHSVFFYLQPKSCVVLGSCIRRCYRGLCRLAGLLVQLFYSVFFLGVVEYYIPCVSQIGGGKK